MIVLRHNVTLIPTVTNEKSMKVFPLFFEERNSSLIIWKIKMSINDTNIRKLLYKYRVYLLWNFTNSTFSLFLDSSDWCRKMLKVIRVWCFF